MRNSLGSGNRDGKLTDLPSYWLWRAVAHLVVLGYVSSVWGRPFVVLAVAFVSYDLIRAFVAGRRQGP